PGFSQRFAGGHRHLLDRGEERVQRWRLLRKLRQRLGPEKHFIRIAHHAVPAEIANLVHNLHGTRSAVSQIAAVEDHVGSGLPQIRQDCLKRGSVAVDVGYDRDAHYPCSSAFICVLQKKAQDTDARRSTQMLSRGETGSSQYGVLKFFRLYHTL